jgi:hypothetical protein
MSEMLNGKSWKTTGAGIAAILVAIGAALTSLTDNDPITTPDWAAVLAAGIAGIGLIFAKDNDKKAA